MVIELFTLLFSLGFSGLITYYIPTGYGHHYWAPFLLIIAGYFLAMIIAWGILFLLSLQYKEDHRFKKRPSKFANFCLSDAITYVNHHAGIKVRVKSSSALPKERYLIICNHRSKFDPMVITQLYGKKNLAFISKPTNFKIPVGHRYMWGANYFSIDRYDKVQSLQIMKDAAELIKSGDSSVGVFPEGTRSETNLLGPFHEGVFSIAKMAKCPIVVTSVMGTEKVKNNFPKRFTKIQFNVLEVLYPSDYDSMIAKEISDHCYQVMKESLVDYEK